MCVCEWVNVMYTVKRFGYWVTGTVKRYIKYRPDHLPSMDCGNKVSAKIFNDSTIATKMSCGRTKSEALGQNVSAPYSQEHLVTELQDAPYFSLCSDASNSGNAKLYPYTVQYFHTEEGVKYGLLEFYKDPHETSSAIYEQTVDITEKSQLVHMELTMHL